MSTFKTNNCVRRWPRQVPAIRHGSGCSRQVWLWACLLGLLSLVGCSQSFAPARDSVTPGQPDELSWGEQLALVRDGRSDEIRLEHTQVSPNELSQLAEVPALKTLILDAGRIDDAHIASLATLSALEHLRLRESPLSDQGLIELATYPLERLIVLNLPQAHPTAHGLTALAALPSIRHLRIAGRQIDDAAIQVLSKWPSLTSLHLIGPSITETSLKVIAGMPELTSFYIDDCPLSDQAWEELFRQRPQLHVHIDQAHHDRDPQPTH